MSEALLNAVKSEIETEYLDVVKRLASGHEVAEGRIKDALVGSGHSMADFDMDLDLERRRLDAQRLLAEASQIDADMDIYTIELHNAKESLVKYEKEHKQRLTEVRTPVVALTNKLRWAMQLRATKRKQAEIILTGIPVRRALNG